MKEKDILQKLMSDKPSAWKEKAEYRKQNKEWLKKSAKIAFRILRELRSRKMTQAELAVQLGVSAQYVNKIVKGSENLQLDTISKIEAILGITLVEVPGLSYVNLSISATNWKTKHDKTKMVASSDRIKLFNNEEYETCPQETLEAV